MEAKWRKDYVKYENGEREWTTISMVRVTRWPRWADRRPGAQGPGMATGPAPMGPMTRHGWTACWNHDRHRQTMVPPQKFLFPTSVTPSRIPIGTAGSWAGGFILVSGHDSGHRHHANISSLTTAISVARRRHHAADGRGRRRSFIRPRTNHNGSIRRRACCVSPAR